MMINKGMKIKSMCFLSCCFCFSLMTVLSMTVYVDSLKQNENDERSTEYLLVTCLFFYKHAVWLTGSCVDETLRKIIW